MINSWIMYEIDRNMGIILALDYDNYDIYIILYEYLSWFLVDGS